MANYMTTYLDEVALFQSVERKRAQSSDYAARDAMLKVMADL
jgi:hypothetical protein